MIVVVPGRKSWTVITIPVALRSRRNENQNRRLQLVRPILYSRVQIVTLYCYSLVAAKDKTPRSFRGVSPQDDVMGVSMSSRIGRVVLLSSSALASLFCLGGMGFAQTAVTLPTVEVVATKKKPAKNQAGARPAQAPVQPASETPEGASARELVEKAKAFDAARSNLYTTIGTTSYAISHDDIQSLPQGANQPVEKVLLQAPGSRKIAASGLLHVRNDHANVQFRINGVMLPDGVTGFGSILDTTLIGTISLVAGALPAEFGLRTVGLVDITTRHECLQQQRQHQPLRRQPRNLRAAPGIWRHGRRQLRVRAPAPGPPNTNCFQGVQYYFTGRYVQTLEGIENSTPSVNPIHDFSQQEKGFGYMSAFIDDSTRLSLIMGTAINAFQFQRSRPAGRADGKSPGH